MNSASVFYLSDHIPVPSLFLRFIQRLICYPDQFLHIRLSASRKEGTANACRHHASIFTLQVHILYQKLKPPAKILISDPMQQDIEFVSAKSAKQILLPEGILHPVCYLFQQLISCHMPICIIHLLEIIHIKENKRHIDIL